MNPIQGLHHITAIARNPQKNLDFYAQVLGQRLVKTTVNFDDPGTYHLYYGDEVASPGTTMTFFPWPRITRGKAGAGETGAVAYTIPEQAYSYWLERLDKMNCSPEKGDNRFGARTLLFQDPDGMHLELITSAKPAAVVPWKNSPVPVEHSISGFHSVTLWLSETGPTAQLLTEQLGYMTDGQHGPRHRFKASSEGPGIFIDLLHTPELDRGTFGAGSVHHIAFRTVDDEEQIAYMSALREAGEQVTSVKDRQYFHSIYFRSHGGVLFEIATDAPGFLYDESVDALGQSLKLPPWLEARRSTIEDKLSPLKR